MIISSILPEPFRGRVAAEQISRGPLRGRWRLLEQLSYKEHTAKEGFITDYATTPRVSSWLYPKSGSYNPAAIIHDWLLEHSDLPHRYIDELFAEMLEVLGTPKIRRGILWAGVRWGSLFRSKQARREWIKDSPKVIMWSIPAFLIGVLPAIAISLMMLVMALLGARETNQ